MNTKKKYIAPALSLFMVQAEEGYAGSMFIDLLGDDEGATNGQENWRDGDNWSDDDSWTWSD